jgi:predicted metalloprotease
MYRRAAVFITGLALIVMVAPAALRAEGPNDDWEVVEDHKSEPEPAAKSQTPQGAGAAQTQAGQAASDVACGEKVRPASDQFKSIVANLDQMWGSDAQIYESMTPAGPHSRGGTKGGCIFYNAQQLDSFTSNWMGIKDADHLEEMMYAINAHELGHIVHGDMTAARAEIPLQTKELEADRFAGYTLWRLHMKRFDAAETEQYYRAVGDDFVGVHGSHGTSKQRTQAFQDGWDLARTGHPEDSNEQPVGGLDTSAGAVQAELP